MNPPARLNSAVRQTSIKPFYGWSDEDQPFASWTTICGVPLYIATVPVTQTPPAAGKSPTAAASFPQ